MSAHPLHCGRKSGNPDVIPASAKAAAVSPLTLPIVRAVRGEPAAASEIMHFSRDQVNRLSAARVEMRRILILIRIDGNQDALSLALSLKNALPVGQDNAPELSIAEGGRAGLCL